MSGDPLPLLQERLAEFLQSQCSENAVVDGIIGATVGWRPHVFEPATTRGWYIHAELPDSSSWADRAARAKQEDPSVRVGVAAPIDFLLDAEFFRQCIQLDASLIVLRTRKDGLVPEEFFGSIADTVSERSIKLPHSLAKQLLDVLLSDALGEEDKQRKGVLLELLVAVLLSQVESFTVKDVGVSNRTQQMDVLVHNKTVSGTLSGSPMVLAEAKNWTNQKVNITEYAAFLRK